MNADDETIRSRLAGFAGKRPARCDRDPVSGWGAAGIGLVERKMAPKAFAFKATLHFRSPQRWTGYFSIHTYRRWRAGKQSGAGARLALALRVDIERARFAIDHFGADDDFLDAFKRRQVEHRIEENRFHDGAKSTRAGLAFDRLFRDRQQGVLREGELHKIGRAHV